MWHSQIEIQTENFCKRSFFIVIYIESDKMTAFWSNDFLTNIFYEITSNCTQKWTNFVKEDFWFDDLFWKWQNECFVTKWQHIFHFLPSSAPALTPTQLGAELALTSISTPTHPPGHPATHPSSQPPAGKVKIEF